MRQAGRAGVVKIEAIVGTDGSVISTRVVSDNVHPDFATAATDAVRQWKFSPTLLNGKPVDVAINVSIRLQPRVAVEVDAVPVVQPQCNVGADNRRKPDIDVMENVFGGVRIMPEDEPQIACRLDLRGRPWLTGVTMSAVQVRLADEPDEDEDEDEGRSF